jgi:hypothetical protein
MTCTVEPDSDTLLDPVTIGVISDVKLFCVGLVIVAELGLVVSTVNVRSVLKLPSFNALSLILTFIPYV